jgi:hypothetical protein
MVDNAKIACSIPIGSLTKFGYQYHWETVLENVSRVFDKVYLISTANENPPECFSKYSKIKFVKSHKYTFLRHANGSEYFDIKKIYRGYNDSLIWAREDNVSVVLWMSINMYISELNISKLRDFARMLLGRDIPYGLCGKAFQIGSAICYANTKIPALINLNHLDDVALDIDVLEYKGKRIGWQGGLYEDGEFYITDVYGSFTPKDLKDKYEWYERSYMRDWKGIDLGEFDARREQTKFLRKLSKLVLNENCTLDATGQKIASEFPSDCLANTLDLTFSSYWSAKLKSYLQYGINRTPLTKFLGNN